MKQRSADRIVAAIRKRGSDADDVRDAAHEACHALDVKLKGKWTRDNVHEALTEFCCDRGVMLYYEIRARAVEKVVCDRLGVSYDVEKWAGVCFMEQIKVARITPPSYEWLLEHIQRQGSLNKTSLMATRIMALR